MIPVRQRLQYVLRRRILTVKKPHVSNPHRGQCISRFNLVDSAERRCLLRSRFIRAAAAARTKHDRHALVLVQRPRKIRRRRALVIRMRHHQENVHFVPLVR